MAVDETLIRTRSPYAKQSLTELVAKATPLVPPAEAAMPLADEDEFQPPPKKSDPLPKPGDRYRAHARFGSFLTSEQKFIHFVHGDFICDGFSYHDLRRVRRLPGDKPGQGPSLVLRFVEAVITEVTIAGRNLDDLHYYIGEGSMPWVWEQPKGFKLLHNDATVITSIEFQEIEK